MITYKFYTDTDPLSTLNKEFMRAVRMSYSHWQGNTDAKLSEVENYLKSLEWDQLDASLIKMAVNQAKSLRARDSVIFGSKVLFYKLKWHKGNQASNQQAFRRSRNTGMLLRGSSSDPNGNRKAQLDIENSQIVVRPRKGVSYSLPIRIPHKRRCDLLELQALCESNDAFFNLQVCDGYVCIIFDESVIERDPITDFIPGRILSIDSNPNYLGVVISDEDNRIVHKEIIDFKDLNHKHTANNKKRHEKHQAVKHLISLAVHYRCEAIAVEKLSMPGENHQKGRTFNRLVNNTWHKNLINNSLRKWCVIRRIKFIPVIAAYSSFLGCIQNPGEFDSIAAAIELNRRARLANKHQRYQLLPKSFDPEHVPTQWKEMGLAVLLANGINSWQELYRWCRDTKFSYRVLYKRYGDYKIPSRSLCSPRSLVQVVDLRPSQVVDLCVLA